MAQLKDTLIQGSARVTDTLYTTTAQLTNLLAPTTAGGTTYGPGTNEYVLMSNGTSIYWGTGVSNAIKALDVSTIGNANGTKYIAAISQTDGKIAATAIDVATTYSATGTTAVSGKSIAAALGTLDFSSIGVAAATGNRFVSQISQTDGKISAVLSTATIGSNKLPVYINAGTITAVTAKDTANNLINALDTGSSDLTANDYVITQYVGGGTTTTTYHRRPANKVINKTLVDAALGASDTAHFYRGDKAWSNTLKQTANAALGIDSNNKIGTARKDLNFDIASGSGTGVNDGYAGGITWGSGTSAYAGIYYQNSGSYGSRLLFGTTGSFANGAYARMIITHDGKVGIGTVSPDTLLTVNGDTNIKGTTDSTNTTTGAVKIAGGLGVAKNVWALKYNNLTLTAATTGFTIAGGSTSKTLTVSESVTLKGGSANYLAYYSTANNIQGHGAARFADTYSSSTKNGKNELVLGNNVASTTNGSAYGQLALYSENTAGTYLKSASGTTWHTATLQAETGVIAYTADITTAINALNVNAQGATNGTKYICAISESAGKINATVSSADIGSSHEPIYIDGGTIKQVIGHTIEYIVGTQTAATNNWTGVTEDSTLYVGKMIAYKLPFAGNSSAAKLTLTLADGTTTAAINLRRQNGNVTTHYPAGSVIFLTYDGTYWHTDGDYDSNSNDTGYYIRYSSGTFTAVTALPRYKVLLQYNETSMLPVNTTDSSADTKKTITTDQFLIFGDYAYFSTNGSVAANAAIAVGATWLQYQFDLRYSFNTASTLTANKDVYLVATPEPDGIHAKLRNPGATGTNASAAATGANAGPITQTLPNSDDGFIYIRLGRAYSTTNIVLTHSHPVYWYKDGSVKQYAPPVTSVALTTTVNSVAYYTDTTGTLGMKSSANGTLYSTSANGALQWGTLPVAQGGTGMTVSPQLQVNLASTSEAGILTASPRPGVTGTLGTGNGGTGTASHTANRIVYATSATALQATGTHYFNGSTLALNSGAVPSGQTLYVNGRVTATSGGGSWLDGQRYFNAAYNVDTVSDSGSYLPWMRMTNNNTGDGGYWFSMGTWQYHWQVGGSKTSYTTNGFQQYMRFNLSNGFLHTTGPISAGSGDITADNGYLVSTKNSNTISIGSQNSDWSHITSSAGRKFYFSNDIHVNGVYHIYNNNTIYGAGQIELYGGGPYIDFHHNNSTADYTCRIASASDGITIFRPSGQQTWINIGNTDSQAGIYFNRIGRGLISDNTGGGCLMTYHSGDGNCPIMAAGGRTSTERHWHSAFIAREGDRANQGDGTVWHCPRIALVWNGRAAITLELHASVTGLYVMRSPQTDGTRAQVYAAGFKSGSGNDYAEERDSLVLQPGKVVTETAVGKMVLADERLLPACRVVSDTYGMSVGQRDNNEFRAPIAVSGRVLVYPYRDRTEYPLGAAVCSAPNGTVDLMTREEIMMYPERIIGTVSEIPNYEVWNGSGIMGDIDSNVLVDGRIWVYVR